MPSAEAPGGHTKEHIAHGAARALAVTLENTSSLGRQQRVDAILTDHADLYPLYHHELACRLAKAVARWDQAIRGGPQDDALMDAIALKRKWMRRAATTAELQRAADNAGAACRALPPETDVMAGLKSFSAWAVATPHSGQSSVHCGWAQGWHYQLYTRNRWGVDVSHAGDYEYAVVQLRKVLRLATFPQRAAKYGVWPAAERDVEQDRARYSIHNSLVKQQADFEAEMLREHEAILRDPRGRTRDEQRQDRNRDKKRRQAQREQSRRGHKGVRKGGKGGKGGPPKKP